MTAENTFKEDPALDLLLCHLIRGQPAYKLARLADRQTCIDAVIPFKDGKMLCAQDISNEVKHFFKTVNSKNLNIGHLNNESIWD